MPEIEIKILQNPDSQIWDDLLQRSPQSTIVHSLLWLQLIEKYTSSKLYIFTGYLGNQIIAAVPLFYHQGRITKGFYSPMGSVMVQHLGPIFPDYDNIKQDKREYYFREFQKELDIFLSKTFKPDFINIITSPKLLDSRPYIWNNYSIIPKYNYKKRIDNLDEVWIGFKKQLRKNIETAQKKGVIVEEGDIFDFRFIIQQLTKRLETQELVFPSSEEYLFELFHYFYPSNLQVFIAKYHGKPITGIIVLLFKESLTIWIGATQTELKGVYPVDLLQWKIIEWGNANGFTYCEILGANMPTISYFKSRYNFDLDIYYSVQKRFGLFRLLNVLQL